MTIERESLTTMLVRLAPYSPDAPTAPLTLTLTPGGASALGALLSRLSRAPVGASAVCLLAADCAADPVPLP